MSFLSKRTRAAMDEEWKNEMSTGSKAFTISYIVVFYAVLIGLGGLCVYDVLV